MGISYIEMKPILMVHIEYLIDNVWAELLSYLKMYLTSDYYDHNTSVFNMLNRNSSIVVRSCCT